VYYTTATGVVEAVTYRWRQPPASFFAPACQRVATPRNPACSGVSVDRVSGTIAFTDTSLADMIDPLANATLNGNLSFTPPGSGSANIVATNASPASGNVTVGAGAAINVEQYANGVNSVEVTAVVNGLEREVKVYFVAATGFVNAVGYRWRPAGGDDIGNANCYDPPIDGFPTCSGITVDTAARVITFNNAYLASIYIVSNATLNGSISYTLP
jgi:hypothetical protein